MLLAKPGARMTGVACSSKRGSASPTPYKASKAARALNPALLNVESCTKREFLMSGASFLLAPLLAQPAFAKPSLRSVTDSGVPSFNGFDGVGGEDADYANAELREIAVGSGGGVASVHVDGFEQLMPIFIGVAEAAALVYATTGGGEGRRPSTLGTWKRSLEATGSKVERVVITRLENHTYYSRIVLLLPGGIKRSVDSRPSDSLALALQCEAPLFVARQLAREQQGPTIDDALEDFQELGPDTAAASSQEAAMSRSRGLQAIHPTKSQRLTV